MSNNQKQDPGAKEIERAQHELEQAKKQFSSTLGGLQYRLKPGNLANHAWAGVRDKGSVVADDAMHRANGFADGAVQAVRDRPGVASGVAAALVIFLARAPLWRAAKGLFSNEEEDPGIIKAHLDEHDSNFDLTAPTVDPKVLNEGVSA